MRKFLKLFLLLTVALAFGHIYAQSPSINITMADSLDLPSTQFFYSMMPDGDIFFFTYTLNETTNETEHYTFWYRKDLHQFTQPQLAGSSSFLYYNDDLRMISMRAYENKANIILGYHPQDTISWLYKALTVTENSLTEHDLSQFNFSSGSIYNLVSRQVSIVG